MKNKLQSIVSITAFTPEDEIQEEFNNGWSKECINRNTENVFSTGKRTIWNRKMNKCVYDCNLRVNIWQTQSR